MARAMTPDSERLQELEHLISTSMEHLRILMDLARRMANVGEGMADIHHVLSEIMHHIRHLLDQYEPLLGYVSRYRAQLEMMDAACRTEGIFRINETSLQEEELRHREEAIRRAEEELRCREEAARREEELRRKQEEARDEACKESFFDEECESFWDEACEESSRDELCEESFWDEACEEEETSGESLASCMRIVPTSQSVGRLVSGKTPSAAPSESRKVTAAPKMSAVEFSAIAPKRLEKDSYSLIDVVMYEENFRHIVDDLIAQADAPVNEKRSGVLNAAIGSRIKVCLSSPDMPIEDDTIELTWSGSYLDFSFAVMLPEDYSKKQVLFIASVYFDGVIATRLKFTAQCVSDRRQNLSAVREDVMSAFISYASQDRHHVATILQGMQKIRPDLDIFFDVDSLRSGEDWEHALWKEISRRDILYLCWSRNARDSKWVEAEWRYALNQKGLSGIEPVPIEPPSLCPPPEELRSKHFNDKLLYIINAAKDTNA